MAPGVLSAQEQPDFETTPVADGVWQFRWRSHNSFWVRTPRGMVVVDPISVEAARTMAAEIERVAPGVPLHAVVYSHHHADHATGASALREAMDAGDAPVLAHENALPPIRAMRDPDLPPPDMTFADRMVLTGERRVELRYLGPSHSDNIAVVWVPDVEVAFAVDFVSDDRVGYRDLPGYHFPEFFTAVARLLEIPFETIVFGHGPPGDRSSVHRQIRYYDALRSAVRDAVEAGWSEDRTAAEVRLPEFSDWGGYDDWFPLNVRALHRWMSSGDGG